MALVSGDIVQLTQNGTLFGETLSNVFYYECINNIGLGTLGHVCAMFGLAVSQPWRELVSEDWDLVDIRGDNVSNGLDFYVHGIQGAGLTLSPSTSSAVAGALSLQVETRLTRPGSKRMGGIPEVYVADNLWSPVIADEDDLTAALIAELDLNDLTTPVDCQLVPVVVGRYPITHQDAGQLDITRFQPIVGVNFRSTITTQTSRRPGRGI